MIEGGWSYVYAAYAITGACFAILALIVVLRLRHWATLARELKR